MWEVWDYGNLKHMTQECRKVKTEESAHECTSNTNVVTVLVSLNTINPPNKQLTRACVISGHGCSSKSHGHAQRHTNTAGKTQILLLCVSCSHVSAELWSAVLVRC